MELWRYRFTHVGYVLLALVFAACQQEPSSIEPSFYHWQTKMELDSLELRYLDRLLVSRLYTKFFDVDWSAERKEAVPLALVEIADWPTDRTLVPTVFLTNRTFKELDENQLQPLAAQVWEKIAALAGEHPIPEVQMDCDWSGSTQDAYFTFLQYLKAKLPDTIQLSVTLRLHQYRNPEQTGVPPADRAMLMCYNVGEVRAWEEENSILRTEAVRPYLSVDSYALPLDFALPLFRWGVLFRRGQMIKLIDGLTAADLADTTYFKSTAPQRYELVKSTYLQGYYLYRGDQIRLESVAVETLKETARLLAGIKRRKGPTYVAFYRLDSRLLETYTYAELEDILASWSP